MMDRLGDDDSSDAYFTDVALHPFGNIWYRKRLRTPMVAGKFDFQLMDDLGFDAREFRIVRNYY